MGRPLKKSFFGNPANPGAQIFLNSARISGQSAAAGYYIVRQVGTGRYQVTNGTLTGVVRLVAAGALQEGEAHVIVKPFGGADEYAKVIHNRSVKTWAGKSYAWSTNAATVAGQADIAGTVAPQTPLSTTAVITGTAQVASPLTASGVATGGTGSKTLSYQWFSSETVNGTYEPIQDATTNTMTPGGGMLGEFVKVQVTATDANGDTAVALSNATAAIIAA